MKVILDIQDNRVSFFMELLKSLDYVSILKEIKDKEKSRVIEQLASCFNDLKRYKEGKKQLKCTKDRLNAY